MLVIIIVIKMLKLEVLAFGLTHQGRPKHFQMHNANN